MRIRTRIAIGEIGWIEYDAAAMRQVGDRLLPAEVIATFPSDATSPALRLRLAIVDGVPQCRDIHIEAKPEGREVRTSDLRSVPLEQWIGDLFAVAASRIVSTSGGVVTAVDEADPRRLTQARRVVERARAASRRSVTDDLLREVADVYRANVDGRPTEAVQRAFGVAHRTAAKYVQLARAKQLLPPTTPGRRNA